MSRPRLHALVHVASWMALTACFAACGEGDPSDESDVPASGGTTTGGEPGSGGMAPGTGGGTTGGLPGTTGGMGGAGGTPGGTGGALPGTGGLPPNTGGGTSETGGMGPDPSGGSPGTGGGSPGTGGALPSTGGLGGGGTAGAGGTPSTGGAAPETGGTAGSTGGSAPSGPPLAFPGAEGFGRETSGGRRGEVVHVTNLDDSGPGSFRDAVSQPGRIVVFDVGGVIHIGERIVISRDIYVAGQTAPGGGITIYGNGIALNGDSGNDIVRYLRIRMGKNGDSGKDAVSISEGSNYMFDHVSISWGRDGTLDVNGSPLDNLSFQECIIAQGINNSNHSTGGLMQPEGVDGHWSMIRSLYIDNKTRNPKARGRHEFINSVLYNWDEHGYIMGDTEGGVSECNLIGNYFIYGPSSNADTHITGTTSFFHVYAEDNWVDSNTNGALDGSPLTNYKTATVEGSPFDYPGVGQQLSAEDAVSHIIEHAGASLVRDAVDELLINQLRSFGTQGSILNTEDDNGIPGNVGTVASGSPPADTDRDGMPDDWETTRGLDPNTPDDAGDDDGDGYTNVEEYLSCIVGEGDC